MDQVYCPIRKLWVAALPEEIVRQKLVAQMTHQLGYPPSYLVLERGLKQMPHLELVDQKVPDRRADIVCFSPAIHPKHALYPLLLVECKAVKLTDSVIQQVIGYNHFVNSYFIAVVNSNEIRTGWVDPSLGTYRFINTLPSYAELLQAIK